MNASAAAELYLLSLKKHDFEGMRRVLAAGVQMRALIPRGPETQTGPDAVVGRLQDWFGGWTLTPEWEQAEPVGDKWSIRYRFAAASGDDHRVVEQHAFCVIGDDGIESIDLVCSGFRMVEVAGRAERRTFDAGDLGCGDGLAAEFRNQLATVPVGGVLEVITSDPAARQDLPPLARMLGNAVHDVSTRADGRTVVVVERRK